MMSREPRKLPPLVVAYEWVARGTTIAVALIAPALAGYWLDQRQRTTYWAVIGMAVGFAIGLWMMVRLARDAEQAESESDRDGPPP